MFVIPSRSVLHFILLVRLTIVRVNVFVTGCRQAGRSRGVNEDVHYVIGRLAYMSLCSLS